MTLLNDRERLPLLIIACDKLVASWRTLVGNASAESIEQKWSVTVLDGVWSTYFDVAFPFFLTV
jgi:hypothetical protein